MQSNQISLPREVLTALTALAALPPQTVQTARLPQLLAPLVRAAGVFFWGSPRSLKIKRLRRSVRRHPKKCDCAKKTDSFKFLQIEFRRALRAVPRASSQVPSAEKLSASSIWALLLRFAFRHSLKTYRRSKTLLEAR